MTRGSDAFESLEFTPIGTVIGGRVDAIDDDWAAVQAEIVLDADRFSPAVLAGLDEFSHIEVVFVFHLVHPDAAHLGARRPRGRVDWPEVGIFAQRAKARPNRIGVTVCELLAVDGVRVTVRGLDAIDGTPVLDVKPYMTGFAPRREVREPPWASQLMSGYWEA